MGQHADIGRLSSTDLVLDCMGSIRSIHLYGKRYRRIVFTIEYEGVIVISIEVLRRELARRPALITETRGLPTCADAAGLAFRAIG